MNSPEPGPIFRMEGRLMPPKRDCVKRKNRLMRSACRAGRVFEARRSASTAGLEDSTRPTEPPIMSKHADWMRALEQLREALDHTAADVARHEQTLTSPLLTSDLSTERHVSWQRALERFAERLQDCQSQVQQAELKARQAEAALTEE